MTTPQTIIAALAVVGVKCSQEMAERVLEEDKKKRPPSRLPVHEVTGSMA